MDEMRIESKFTRGIASRLIKKAMRDKLDYNVDVQLNKFRTTVIEEKTHVHLDIELDLSKEELDKLLKSIGL